jgi:hypothetical protein
MSFRSLFQQLGFWTTVLSWQEPGQYRARLRGDVLIRLGLAAAIGCVPMTLLLVLFAINVNPPHPAFALAGFLIGAVLAGLILFMGESSAGGAVRVCQEGITRKRTYIPRIPVHMGIEEASWPYESISRAILVPGQSIGQSFSVLLLTDEVNVEIVGVPGNISLQQLAQAISARGVRVESGAAIPESFTRPIAWPLAAAAGAVGLMVALGGLGFYAIKTLGDGGEGGGGGRVARAPAANRAANAQPAAAAPLPAGNAQANARGNSAPPPPPPAEANRQARAAPPPPAAAPAAFPTIPQLPRAPVARDTPDPFAAPAAAGAGGAQGRELGELIGGKGGFAFQSASPAGQPVLGFRYALGAWAGKKALAQLEPLYERNPAGGGPAQVLAKEGYAVGGLALDTSDLVHAVRVVFVRQKPDGSLDPADTYTSDWLGAPAGNPPQTLTSGQSPILGIHGRKGAVIDALGLVVGEP